MILIDSNVWIDLIQRDPVWMPWSREQVIVARQQGPVAINAVIYAELVPNYDSAQALDEFVTASRAVLQHLSPECAYLAARAFEQYRKQGGKKTGVVADFFIGAQAVCEGWMLLTRDAARYKTYFPKIKLICPDQGSISRI